MSPAAPALAPASVLACTAWYAQLDSATATAHVQDGQAARPEGFAFLRVNRLLQSFGAQVALDLGSPAAAAWVERLAQLDKEARAVELANMPAAGVPQSTRKEAAAARTRECSALLVQALLGAPEQERATQLQRVVAVARVPDDYSDWKRAAGLYSLTRVPFFAGVRRWQDGLRERFASEATKPLAAGLLRYVPQTGSSSAAGVDQLPTDALGIPVPSAEWAERLLDAHAPALEVETTGDHDRPGALRWGAGPAPEVATAVPTAYRRLVWTRWGKDVLPQLVYSFWFAARPAQGGLDLLAGQLDAVVLRITLGKDGAPLVVDSIHACGCYHLFFPAPAVQLRPAPVPGEEWAFVPKHLPALRSGERLRVRLESRTHYVVGLDVDPGGAGRPYAALADDALRTLPAADGTTRSAFWPNGIVPGTERGERALFWPMGIDSPGAMRQWGRQPTAFVGRRHFDDARLMEERFERQR